MSPKDLFTTDEESGAEKFAEEYTIPGTEELKSLENWSHRHPIILKAGRTTHTVPNYIAEDEKDAYLDNLNTTDAPVDKYRTLNEDTPFQALEFSWISKLVGDPQPYN